MEWAESHESRRILAESALNSMGFATFMVDSNWGRKKCKKDSKEFKKSILNGVLPQIEA